MRNCCERHWVDLDHLLTSSRGSEFAAVPIGAPDGEAMPLYRTSQNATVAVISMDCARSPHDDEHPEHENEHRPGEIVRNPIGRGCVPDQSDQEGKRRPIAQLAPGLRA